MILASPRVIRGNRGDIASRHGILRTILEGGSSFSAVFASREMHLPRALRRRLLPYGPAYNLWPGWRGVRALRQAAAVIWTGGLDLQDDSSLLKLLHTWLVFASYRLLGLKILIAMQGAGPLATSSGRWLAARVLALTDLVLVRDLGSYRLLCTIMPQQRLRLAADGIFLPGFPQRGDRPELPPAIETICAVDGRPLVGLNVRMWFHFANSLIPYQFRRRTYRKRAEAPMLEFLSAIEAIVAGLRRKQDARIVLVSMYEPGVEPWEDDAPLLAEIKARFVDDPEVILLDDDLAILDLCALLARFDLMIGTRLHSTLIALRAGVPAIHLAYTLKGRDIYRDLGLSDWIVAIEDAMRTPQAVVDMAQLILTDPQSFERVRAVVEPVVGANEHILLEAVESVRRG